MKSSAYPDKLIRTFNRKFRECGFGTPPPVSKKVRGMLNGLIKVCRGSDWEEETINRLPELLVDNWEFIKKQDHHTLTGKRAMLGDRPSLLEFLICRESVLNAIERSKYYNQKEEVANTDTPSIEVKENDTRTTRSVDIADEYEKMMEDML
jgi:hypothetical protein